MFNSTIYFQTPSSNKQYTVLVQRSGKNLPRTTVPSYHVIARYGKIGGTEQETSKTPKPIALADAKELAQRLIDGKLAKGYTTKLRKPMNVLTARVTAATSRVALAIPNQRVPAALLPPSRWFRPAVGSVIAATYLDTHRIEGGTHFAEVTETGKDGIVAHFAFHDGTARANCHLRWSAADQAWKDVTDRCLAAVAPASVKQQNRFALYMASSR